MIAVGIGVQPQNRGNSSKEQVAAAATGTQHSIAETRPLDWATCEAIGTYGTILENAARKQISKEELFRESLSHLEMLKRAALDEGKWKTGDHNAILSAVRQLINTTVGLVEIAGSEIPAMKGMGAVTLAYGCADKFIDGFKGTSTAFQVAGMCAAEVALKHTFKSVPEQRKAIIDTIKTMAEKWRDMSSFAKDEAGRDEAKRALALQISNIDNALAKARASYELNQSVLNLYQERIAEARAAWRHGNCGVRRR
ncbi:hypothetical protein [Polyangium sp. y55x31]|uniref:hypothetical protein n=1 Tax=Polyangium sp. y55x31 TaxID=3042688 RepID=UPI0024830682|nr:hypothetical protein [Polyangium sp. y55x31]MDI1484650.1 hypothetical protein [Polyangium sp. y55x31]